MRNRPHKWRAFCFDPVVKENPLWPCARVFLFAVVSSSHFTFASPKDPLHPYREGWWKLDFVCFPVSSGRVERERVRESDRETERRLVTYFVPIDTRRLVVYVEATLPRHNVPVGSILFSQPCLSAAAHSRSFWQC